MAHAVFTILEVGQGADLLTEQFIDRYKRLFSQSTVKKNPDFCRVRTQIISFARQLHGCHIANKVVMKTTDTLGVAFRFAFKLTGGKYV